jgi:hypothetical protein
MLLCAMVDEMTKLEIIEFTQRIAAKLARAESSPQPISEERLKRIEALRLVRAIEPAVLCGKP